MSVRSEPSDVGVLQERFVNAGHRDLVFSKAPVVELADIAGPTLNGEWYDLFTQTKFSLGVIRGRCQQSYFGIAGWKAYFLPVATEHVVLSIGFATHFIANAFTGDFSRYQFGG